MSFQPTCIAGKEEENKTPALKKKIVLEKQNKEKLKSGLRRWQALFRLISYRFRR